MQRMTAVLYTNIAIKHNRIALFKYFLDKKLLNKEGFELESLQMSNIIFGERIEIFELLFKAGVDVNRVFEFSHKAGKHIHDKNDTCVTGNFVGFATF